MKPKIVYLLLIVLSISCTAITQNTVGLLSKKENSFFSGYSLIYPFYQANVYLIDTCGQIVHQWPDDDIYEPGLVAYLMPNGNLIKAKRNNNFQEDPINLGSSGGIVEILSWNNELLHSFELNDSLNRLHHDIEPMPNGNILMIAWEWLSLDTLLSNGRDQELMPNEKILSERIIEWNPTLDSIVWEWRAFDHLVQDYDSLKQNFGNVNENPHRININYPDNNKSDWLHFNSIDYNPVLDQILISVPEFNEFWIIDHSTTTNEAKISSGGLTNKGGDILYRWGNPIAFSSGIESDQKLFYQHDVHWTNPESIYGEDDFNEILIFNNRTPEFSRANIMDLSFDVIEWQYFETPIDFKESFNHPNEEFMASSVIVSSAQKLSNNNILLMSGRWGYAYELNEEGELVWEYRIPFQNGNRVEQGFEVGIKGNLSFKMKKYSEEYEAFSNIDLVPQGYLELNPNPEFCDLSSSIDNIVQNEQIIYPNPFQNNLTIEVFSNEVATLITSEGIQTSSFELKSGKNELDFSYLPNGMYYIKTFSGVKKIFKYDY